MSNNNNNTNNNNTIQGNGLAQDLSLPKDRKDLYQQFAQRKDFAVKVNGIEVSDKESETVAGAMKQAGSAFSLVQPKTEQSKLLKFHLILLKIYIFFNCIRILTFIFFLPIKVDHLP